MFYLTDFKVVIRGWKLVGSRTLRRKGKAGLSGDPDKKRTKLEAYCNVVAGDLFRTGAWPIFATCLVSKPLTLIVDLS